MNSFVIKTFLLVAPIAILAQEIVNPTNNDDTRTNAQFSLNKDFLYDDGANFQDKFSSINGQAAYDSIVNITSVAATPLASLATFVGQIAYPTFVTCATIFFVYTVFQLVAYSINLVFSSKVSVLSSILNLLSSSGSAVFEKVVSVNAETDDDRARRAAGFLSHSQLMQLLSGVNAAIEKFQEE